MRVFRSEDGAELREEDLRCYLTGQSGTDWVAAGDRIAAALAPRTCGAIIVWSDKKWGETTISCVLAPGHHPYAPEVLHSGTCNALVVIGGGERRCSKVLTDPIHAPGHMPAPECWREP